MFVQPEREVIPPRARLFHCRAREATEGTRMIGPHELEFWLLVLGPQPSAIESEHVGSPRHLRGRRHGGPLQVSDGAPS